MDILVSIPRDQEDYVRATKLNPISGFTEGYWTLSGHPRFTKSGDRIWFCIFGQVVASAKILFPQDEFENRSAVSFKTCTVLGHEFYAPRELPLSFRGFRYVRRVSKHTNVKYTKALELVGAKGAERVHSRN